MNRLTAALLGGFATLALTACGGGSGSDTVPTATQAPATPTATGAQANAEDAAGTGASRTSRVNPELLQTPTVSAGGQASSEDGIPRGGVFRRLWGDPPTLDPHQVSDTTSAGIVVEIFSGLVKLGPDLNIVPDLAKSWEISEDGVVYTFKLQEDLKFSDGTPVTAADFKYSLERAAKPETESTVSELYLGDIVGMEDVIDGSATSAEGIKVIDEHTLRITIDEAKPYFLAKLTYPTAYVVKKENVESGPNWTDSAAGTGPFALEEYQIGERIVLARNEHYHGRNAYLDQVLLNLSGGVPMAMYETDEIDITGVGLAELERVQDPESELNDELVQVPPGFSVSYIGFNVSEPPFDDVNFRKALNYAVNKELIASEVYSGLVKPAYGVVPPGFPGYNPDLEGLKYDPEQAIEHLEKSQYADAEDRPRIVITIPGTGGTPGLDVEVVADMWRTELNVDAEIQQVEWATYLQDLNRERMQAFGGLGWEADYPDPQDFLDILFHSASAGNHTLYGNPRVDGLLEEARTEQDPQKRIDLYNEAEKIIVQEAAWLPLWFDTQGLALVKPRVKGYEFTPIIVPKLKDVYIKK